MGSPQLQTVRGIVLRTVKYGDSGVVVDLYTESYGRVTVMTYRTSPSSTRKGTRTHPTYLMPLSMVEMQCPIPGGRNRMPHVRNISSGHTYKTLHTHPLKSMIAMFVAEFLSNILHEESADSLLYQYLERSLLWLDAAESHYANFHLVLLMRMTRFMGIEPQAERSLTQDSLFDLQTCEYTQSPPHHTHFLNAKEAAAIPYILHMNYDNMHLYPLSHNQRYRILEVINTYYQLHFPAYRQPKSMEILKDILV